MSAKAKAVPGTGFRDRLVLNEAAGEYRDGSIRYLMMWHDVLMGLFAELPEAQREPALRALGRSVQRHGGRSVAAYHAAGAANPDATLRTIEATSAQLVGRNIKLVARKDITGPERIRKFGIVAGTVSQYATGLAVSKFGLDPAAVQYVRSGPPELPALLARGDIDAYFAWEPWPSIGLRQGGHVVTNSGNVGYTDTLWLNTQASWLEGNANTARAVLRGLARACASVQQDPQRAAAAVQAATRIPPTQSLALYKDVDFGVRNFTDVDLASYDRIADFLADQKVTAARVDFRRAIQRGFVKA